MSKWLRAWRDVPPESLAAPVYELLVIEGDDAGQRFTLEGDTIPIGRRPPQAEPGADAARTNGIQLHDGTVSASQASVSRRGQALVLHHDARATNPTLVNGREVDEARLGVGDRIAMGHVVLELRERAGLSLSGLTRAFAEHEARAGSGAAASARAGDETVREGGLPTEVRPMVAQVGLLHVEEGRSLVDETDFTLWATTTTIGRATDRDVRIHDLGVSRHHCELRASRGELRLVHLSRVNGTLHNGLPVQGEVRVADGDTIGLADRVVLRVRLDPMGGVGLAESTTESRGGSLRGEMEAKLERDRSIEERFSVEGSFLDVDVVDSYGMKAEAGRPEHIIVSFERFRAFVERVVTQHGGLVLNSNGDELMCFFDDTSAAVRAAWDVLEQRPAFNAAENVLERGFSFRLGVHTGRSLVDFDRGVAYSAVLDLAGHLQKRADVNGLVISEDTLARLPVRDGFEAAGLLEREGIAYYRMTAPLGQAPTDERD